MIFNMFNFPGTIHYRYPFGVVMYPIRAFLVQLVLFRVYSSSTFVESRYFGLKTHLNSC